MLVGPTIRRRRLGTDLRRLRESRSLKLEDVAAELGVAPSTLSRIETGKAPTRASYLTIMLELYGVVDPVQRGLLMEMAREGQRKGWWADCDDLLTAGFGTYLGLEAEASVIRAFHGQVVHALVQTEEYATAVLAAGRPGLASDQVARLVAIQLRRQETLRRDDPVELHLVLDESVLLRKMGSHEVMAGQLDRLLTAGGQGSVRIQVLPLRGSDSPVVSGSFAILSFAEPADSDVVCAESIRGQVLLEERATEVGAMRRVFESLSAAALSPAESAGLIRAVRDEIDDSSDLIIDNRP